MDTYTHLMFLTYAYGMLIVGALALVCMMLSTLFFVANWLVTRRTYWRTMIYAIAYSVRGKHHAEKTFWAALDEQAASSEHMAGYIIERVKQHMPPNP